MIRTFIANRSDGDKEMVEISDEFGNATQLLKSVYDEQQAALPKDTWVEPQLTK